jgi:hypothetical protein
MFVNVHSRDVRLLFFIPIHLLVKMGTRENMTIINKLLFCAICVSTALAVSFATVSEAQVITNGTGVSLANLTNGDFTAGQVTVTPITLNGNFGIQFSGPFVANNASLSLGLGYEVSVTNSLNLISAANMLFTGQVVAGSGSASVTEQVFTNSTLYGSLTVFNTTTSGVSSASLAITPPQGFLSISNSMSLMASISAFSTISTIDQAFTQVVPEPSAMALVAAGFAGLALLRRRRR